MGVHEDMPLAALHFLCPLLSPLAAHPRGLATLAVDNAGAWLHVTAPRDTELIPERVVHLLAQVCDSLGEAHANRLVHRDIKPSNIYVCRYGRQVDFVKVLDFGLVKRVRGFEDDRTQLQLTAPLAISGTPALMAPEQVLGGADTDARTDLYAVGCVAFWLLTGRTVFQGSTVMQVLMKHVHDEPLPPSRCSELSVPAALDAVILRCLAKSPDDRPQSADELAEALTAACDPRTWTKARASEGWKRKNE